MYEYKPTYILKKDWPLPLPNGEICTIPAGSIAIEAMHNWWHFYYDNEIIAQLDNRDNYLSYAFGAYVDMSTEWFEKVTHIEKLRDGDISGLSITELRTLHANYKTRLKDNAGNSDFVAILDDVIWTDMVRKIENEINMKLLAEAAISWLKSRQNKNSAKAN